jgi:hypothetical protein
MLEELRKKSKHSLMVKLVVFAIIIAVCMVITKASFITYLQGPVDLSTLDEWDVEDLDGKYVTLEIDTVLGGFAEETSTNTKTNITKTTSICYVCEYYDEAKGLDHLYAIKASMSQTPDIENVMNDATYTTTYRITGTFEKMSGEMLQYYDETIEEGLGAEGLDYALPYCIYDQTIGGLDYGIAVILNLAAFISLIAAVVSIINYIRGYHDRYFKKYLKKNLRESMAGIEAEYLSADVLHKNYRLGKKYFFYSKGGTMSLIPIDEQVWAYYYRKTGKNSVSQIKFFDLEHKGTYVNINQTLAETVLGALNLKFNHIVLGYDANLQKMYTKNFNDFLNIRYNEAKAAAAAQDTF